MDWINRYLNSTQAWDAENRTAILKLAVFGKGDAVRVANLLRNNGYSVEIDDSLGEMYSLEVRRNGLD